MRTAGLLGALAACVCVHVSEPCHVTANYVHPRACVFVCVCPSQVDGRLDQREWHHFQEAGRSDSIYGQHVRVCHTCVASTAMPKPCWCLWRCPLPRTCVVIGHWHSKEEQRRLITMKSSSISLLHYDAPYRGVKQNMRSGAETRKDKTVYLVNLVDSPGHVDFSSDVSTALRISDGALVVVDAVEGVCSQTMAVLRQAWKEGVKTCLVVNKVDRLITEMQLTPREAHDHLQRVVEHVNAVCSELFTADVMAAADDDRAGAGAGAGAGAVGFDEDGKMEISSDAWDLGLDEHKEAAAKFSPRRGNVVFASARDGWAFRCVP